MKSIKPGRGPSMMGGISSIFAALFGVLWTILAASMGGGIFALFGIFFIGMAITSAVYNIKNATGKNRYSSFDITEGHEEPDPFNEYFGNNTYYSSSTSDSNSSQQQSSRDSKYCPYCGTKVEGDYLYCNQCGKKLP